MNSIGGSSGFDPARMAAELFKKADTNSDGGIDKSELKAMMSSKGPADNVDKVFASADTNGDGKIDSTENASFLQKVGTEMQARSEKSGSRPPQGGAGGMPPPPSGGGQGGGGAQDNATVSNSSDSTKTYDPRDTNKDGKVSYQEEVAYAQKHPEKQENNPNSSQSKNVIDNAKSAVEEVVSKLQSSKKYGSDGNVSTSGVQSAFSLFT